MKSFIKLACVLFVTLVIFACKTEATPTTWTVTVDPNGGDGLQTSTYQVTDGDSLDKLNETPTFYRKHISGYKTSDGADFQLGSTPVNGNITIIAQWAWDDFDCSLKTDSIFAYAKLGEKDGIACVVKNNTDVNLKDSSNIDYTAFYYAITNGYLDATKYLAQLGADPTLKLSNSNNILIQVLSSNTTSTLDMLSKVKYLLTLKGIDINYQNTRNFTAFMAAVNNYKVIKDIEVIKTLSAIPGINLNTRVIATDITYPNKTALGIVKKYIAIDFPQYVPMWQELADYLVSLGATE